MKAQILKIAGVKNEKEFYKKFPTEEAFLKKHGKELKKAQGGLKTPLPKEIPVNIPLPTLTPIKPTTSSTKSGGFDWASLAGDAIGAVQAGNEASYQNKKMDQYLGISQLQADAAKMPAKKKRSVYIRPEDQLVAGANPLGVAENGAMIGGNPTEVQNMYNIGDIYTDLEDTNPKQYQWGGELGNLSSGRGVGQGAAPSQGWDLAGKAAGASGIPIIGDIINFMGQIEANEQQDMFNRKIAQFQNNLTAGAINNVNAGQFAANVKYGGSFDSMEDGGWVSHNWQPQVITKFGDLDVSEVHAFAHEGMPEYRAGGHLKEYTPPSAEALQTFGDGGQLQTLWGGGIKEAGVNPIIGKLGMLSGGYHSQRASDAPGQKGIGVNYGGNIIEAENGEGIVELANGGAIDPATGKPGKSAYIFGAEKMQDWAKKAIEDKDIKVGTTFKHYFDTKTKLQKKLNKQEINAREEAANLVMDNPIAKLRANAIEATLNGIKMQNMDIAKHITNAAAVQTAINETDEEMGTAKYGGVLKKAAFGAKLTTAKGGMSLSGVDPAVSGLIDLLKRKGYNLQVTSGLRKGAKTRSGNDSRHGSGEAIDVAFPKLGSKAYDAILKDAEVVKYMMDKGLTAINEYDPKIARKTGATGPHIHFGKDSGTGLADRFRKAASTAFEDVKGFTEDIGDYIKSIGTPDVKSSTKDLYRQPAAKRKDINVPKKVPVYTPPSYATAPVQQAAPVSALDELDMEVNRRNDALLAPKKIASSPVFPSPTNAEGDYYMSGSEDNRSGIAPEYLPSIAMGLPSDGLLERLNDINIGGQQFGSYTPREEQAYQEPELQPVQQPVQPLQKQQQLKQQTQQQPMATQQQKDTSVAGNPSSGWASGLEKIGNGLEGFGKQVMTGLESALPYLRPSNQRQLDPQALTGEMFALATNQLEPVQAQKFVPYLTQGIQVSLQDQLNEVTAQTRAAERMARGNPEALAMIASQAYDAKNKIKGEEFRLNQVEKQRVAETNRQVMNEANRENLGIMDQQYVRQQTAKSKTKEQAIVALNSISDKILKNKLENKELGVYENMYNYRFGPNGQAYNMNIANFNTPNVGAGAKSMYDLSPLEKEQALLDAKKAKAKSVETKGQGGIVKAMHEL